VPQSGDCDDLDATRHPGAVEHCNGVDDDCDTSTTEVGLVSFFSQSRGTAERVELGAENPPFEPPGAGILRLCDGEHVGRVTVTKDLLIEGQGGRPVLDGGGDGSVIDVSNGANVAVEQLVIRGGDAPQGGGVHCTESRLTLRQVVLQDNRAIDGGGVYAEDCELTTQALQAEGNQAAHQGGALAVMGGSWTDQSGALLGNHASVGAGAFLQTEAIWLSTEIRGNTADHCAALSLDDGSLIWTGDDTYDPGARANQAPESAQLCANDASLSLDYLRFGMVPRGDRAIDLLFDGVPYALPDVSNITCDRASCGQRATASIGAHDAFLHGPTRQILQPLIVDEAVVIEKLGWEAQFDEVGCEISSLVYATSSVLTGDYNQAIWTVEREVPALVSHTNVQQMVVELNLAAHPDRTYIFALEADCDFSIAVSETGLQQGFSTPIGSASLAMTGFPTLRTMDLTHPLDRLIALELQVTMID